MYRHRQTFPQKDVITSDVSDHECVYVTLNLAKKIQPPRYITYLSMRNFNHDAFLAELMMQPWDNIFESPNVDNKALLFSEYFAEVLDNNAPFVRKRKPKETCRWINRDCLDAKREKFQWLSQYRSTGNYIAGIMYRHFKTKERRLIRQAEREYINSQLQKNANNSRDIWNTMSYVLPRKQRKQLIPSERDQALCEQYNDHFISVGKCTAESARQQAISCGCSPDNQLPTLQTFNPEDQFYIRPVTEQEVRCSLLQMKSQKSPGLDSIKPYFLKVAMPVILPVLTHVINSTFRTNVFPRYWKHACVIPIQKIKGNLQPRNQRPISLLPICSKLCEKLILKQFMTYLDDNEKLSCYQNGSRPRYSTETAMLRVTNNIAASIDEKKVSLMISFDCSKAFDSVNHMRLLRRLQNVGVSDIAIKWFKSYLGERKQCVKINYCTSQSKAIHYGVPQGSVLGGLLFCLYVDPILSVINCGREMYVDDLVIYRSYSPSEHQLLNQTMNDDCVAISKWFCSNDLLLNAGKTQAVVFGTKTNVERIKPNINIKMNGEQVQLKDSIKYLGIQLDSCLTMKEHCQIVSSKCGQLLARISRIRYLLNEKN